MFIKLIMINDFLGKSVTNTLMINFFFFFSKMHIVEEQNWAFLTFTKKKIFD